MGACSCRFWGKLRCSLIREKKKSAKKKLCEVCAVVGGERGARDAILTPMAFNGVLCVSYPIQCRGAPDLQSSRSVNCSTRNRAEGEMSFFSRFRQSASSSSLLPDDFERGRYELLLRVLLWGKRKRNCKCSKNISQHAKATARRRPAVPERNREIFHGSSHRVMPLDENCAIATGVFDFNNAMYVRCLYNGLDHWTAVASTIR